MEPAKREKRSTAKVQYFILIVTLIIFLTIILIIAIVYQKYRRVKTTVRNIKRTVLDIIPKMSIKRYSDIGYPKKFNLKLKDGANVNNDDAFNRELSETLCKFIMSSYNLSSGFDALLPPYATVVKKLGDNGYLYKIDSSNYVIAYRGTNSKEDIATDVNFSQVPLEGNSFITDTNSDVMVHTGFFNLWLQQKDDIYRLKDIISGDKPINLYITGHSLGASTAVFTALDLSKLLPKNVKIVLYLFASPRVGNSKFIDAVHQQIPNYWSIENRRDMVVTLPPPAFGFLGQTWIYDDYRRILQLNIETGNVVNNHHLDTYAAALDAELPANLITYWNRTPKIILL